MRTSNRWGTATGGDGVARDLAMYGWSRAVWVAVLAVLLGGSLGAVQADEVPGPAESAPAPAPLRVPPAEITGPARAAKLHTSFVPIPEIITDPNEGNTYGVLGVWLLLDDDDEIRYMIAPDVRYNDTKGLFPTARLFAYPTSYRAFSITLGKSTTKDEDYSLDFLDRGLWNERAFVYAMFEHGRDSTERFYGFGNDSPESGESNYTGQDTIASLRPGVWVFPGVNVSYQMRARRFAVQRGQVGSLPFTPDAHPEVADRGAETAFYWAHGVAVAYDTRDSIDIPQEGTLASVYAQVADRSLGSSTSFVKFGAEALRFQPLLDDRLIVAGRLRLDYTSGSQRTPFWELFSLGGHRSLRGFGSGRFYDFNRALATLEARVHVWERRLFGVRAELQVAPFVETGQVFRDLGGSPVADLHWVYGIGFRGLARPRVVGFVDIGKSSEGVAVFTGINYPF